MTNEELVRHAYNCGVAWALKSEKALTVDQFIEANLIPVQSGGVVTREVIGEAVIDGLLEYTSSLGNIGNNRETWHIRMIETIAAHVEALQLPAPTPQPEAGGMDLSGVRMFLEEIVSTKAENKDLWIGTVKANAYGFLGDLSHLQQAPQPEAQGIEILEELAKLAEGGIIGQHLADFPGLVGRRIRQALNHFKQTEARGVKESFRIVWDESAFNAWNDRTYTFEKWLKSGAYYRALAHLQQAPQWVGESVAMTCPNDLCEAVNNSDEFQWIVYDMNLMPEQITTREEVCALRGAWIMYNALTELRKQEAPDPVKVDDHE